MSVRPEDEALLSWFRRPVRGELDGARLNLCYNALDRHVVAGRADEPALTGPRDGDGASYAGLLERVAALAGGLAALGVGRGDVVGVGLPLGADAVVALLAATRLGAVPEVLTPGAEGAVAVLVRDAAGRCVVQVRGEEFPWEVLMRAGATDPAACEAIGALDPGWRHDGKALPAGPLALAGLRSMRARGAGPGASCPVTALEKGPAAVLAPLLAGAALVLGDPLLSDPAGGPSPGPPGSAGR